ncbi:hypothetical protein E2H86_01015 [Pseudomonas putida]|jgi:hypothetical protein|uniref:hypothetical protein n=1 Tax=Pseudomonas putida TaxID=303 RepID=UPI001059CA10|nr:hypothetical protein [Pseudomonas putida]TDJ79211.1 hypothetical protein E2H86_01015 [Pseudomonas putida]
MQHTLAAVRKELAAACEQRSAAQAHSVALSELRDQARLTAQQSSEQCQTLQDRLERMEAELMAAQRIAAAQEHGHRH